MKDIPGISAKRFNDRHEKRIRKLQKKYDGVWGGRWHGGCGSVFAISTETGKRERFPTIVALASEKGINYRGIIKAMKSGKSLKGYRFRKAS